MKLLLTCLALLLALPAPGAEKAAADKAANPPEGHRYLFLFDASAAMAPNRDATAGIIEGLLMSGMNGELRTGDAFALWPFRGEVVNDAFPPETWFADLKEEHAATAKEFVILQKFEGKVSLARAVDELLDVVSGSRSVTVFLLSDGSENLRGTPFDLYANAVYRDQAAAMRKLKRPFVTSFLAVDGKIVDCLITAGAEKVVAPKIPDAIRNRPPAPKPVAKAESAPAPVAPKSTAQPLIVRKPKPEPVPEVPPAVAPPAKPAVPSVDSGSLTMSFGTVQPPSPAAGGSSPAQPVAATPAVPASTPAVPTAATPASAVAPVVKEPAVAALVPVAPQPFLSRRALLIIGVGLVLAALVIIWFIARSFRPHRQPSLISRSMNR